MTSKRENYGKPQKKKIVIAVVIAGLLCAATGICWFIYRDSQKFTTLPRYEPNPSIEDISGIGKGSVE